MSLFGTIGFALGMRVGDVMFAPAVSALKVVGGQALTVLGAGVTGYGAYKMVEQARYKTTYSMYLDRHWGDFGLEIIRKNKKVVRPKYIKEEKVSEYLYKSYFRLPPGMAIKDIADKTDEIELALNAEIDVYRENEYCVIEISTGHLRYEIIYDVKEVLQYIEDMKNVLKEKIILPFVVGDSKRGFQIIDLARHPHALVGGMTGGGKSVFMRQMINSMMHYLPPERLIMYGIDLKGGLEFQLFREAPHIQNIARNVWETFSLLKEIEEEMDRRQELLYQEGVPNIYEYMEKTGKVLPYIVTVIDELGELSPDDVNKDHITTAPPSMAPILIEHQLFDPAKAKAKQGVTVKTKDMLSVIHATILRLLRLARALGIHLILATQRPDVKVLPGGSKANIPITVAFHVRNKVNSQILLDSDSAATLPPTIPGRGILQVGSVETEIQVPLLTTKEARKLLEKLEEDLLTHTKEDFETPTYYIPEEFYEGGDPFDFISMDFTPRPYNENGDYQEEQTEREQERQYA